MLKLTVRELSEELGITKQAVFNHIKRNPEAFEGHVEKEGNHTLDEIGAYSEKKKNIYIWYNYLNEFLESLDKE